MTGRRRQLEVTCSLCEKETWKDVSNLKRGVGAGCRCLQNKGKYPDLDKRLVGVLGERYDAMVQRCKPGGYMSKRYGDRGIRLHFDSREHFIRWAAERWDYEEVKANEFDREDNEGHYSPDNLRLVSSTVNNVNKSSTTYVSYMGKDVAPHHVWHLMMHDHPDEMEFSHGWTVKLLKRGLTPNEILQRSHSGKGRPRLTSSTPDPFIVSLYRDG